MVPLAFGGPQLATRKAPFCLALKTLDMGTATVLLGSCLALWAVLRGGFDDFCIRIYLIRFSAIAVVL